MASPDTQNEVVNSQSVGDASTIDSHAQNPDTVPATDGADTLAKPQASELLQPAVGVSATPDGDVVSVDGSVRDTGSVADVGSDTDNSRADELGKDGNGALKSAKKPAIFKAVSVTRNFLAKTASAASAAVKSGDKPAPAAGTPVTLARPRLVAKSGSGLRDSPRPHSGADSPADGATVWNKNRPAPPAPAKHFTDEELKQQYGIHLASRLQADDDNKQSKWADLDDEEDDWAPETVEWMDGTKSTINPEPIPVPAAKLANITIEPRPFDANAKPILTPLKRPTGPPKTVLRPGAALEARQELANARDAQAQKPLSGPKTPAPLPSKSPWATLPPVDKAAPLTQFEALQTPTHRQVLGSQDARMMDGSFNAPYPHEMEADTFDRTWRRSDRGPRELFNSQSGRYEPAPEGRRGSMRREQGFKGTSVLRRPSQSEAMAEPYAARSGEGGWPRRRGSSITAQDAQAIERRLSSSQKDAGGPPDNRTGVVIGHDIGPQTKQPSKQALNAQQQAEARQEELARQKKIMQEKRELAIRRRKEEEEKEEAARRERIRLKLESLGPGPSKASPTPTSAANTADQTTTKQGNEAHPEHAAQSRSTVTGPRSPEKAKASAVGAGQLASSSTFASSAPTGAKSPPSFRSPGLSADTFATWGNRPGQTGNAAVSNVWGPAGPSRHIGNGAFSSTFSRIPPRMQNQNISLAHDQAFAATPHGVRSASTGPRQETSPMRHQQMLSTQNLAALGLADSPTSTFPPGVAAELTTPLSAQAQPLSPIAPPGRQAQAASSVQQSPRRGPSNWTQFSNQQDDGVSREFGTEHQQSSHQRWREPFKQHAYGGHSSEVPLPPMVHSQQPPIASAHARDSTVRLPTAGANKIRSPVGPAPVNASGQHQSRFFPSSMIGGGSPPPEEHNHPVYSDGNVKKPTVNLPTPKPHVRLPPAALAALQAQSSPNVIMPDRAASFRGGAQPLVQSSDWQARFNGLFGRIQTTTAIPPSPPRTPPKANAVPSSAVLSSSKGDLFDVSAGLPATVSLPFRNAASSADTDMMSRATVDDIFDGELSFGSTPKVTVPRSPNYNTQPDRSGIHILNMRPNARFDKPIESLSRTAAPADAQSKRSISVHIPNSKKGAREIHLQPQQAERIFSEGGARVRKTNTRGAKVAKVPMGAIDSETSTPVQSPAPKERKASGKFGKGLKVPKSREQADKVETAEKTPALV